MIALFLLLVVVALGLICFFLAQIVASLTMISASLQVDALKKAGVVDEIREAVLRRSEEKRTA